MKKYKFFISIFIISILVFACEDVKFLDYNPGGSLSEEQLSSPDAAEKLCNAAYATLAAGQWRAPYNSKWLWGSVRSDDAYKGGGGTNDQGQWNLLEGYVYFTPQLRTWADHDKMWTDIYFCIFRVNTALRSLKNLTEEEFPEKTARMAEMRFLRGHYYYALKVLFRYIPYLDEEMTTEDIKETSNRELSDEELWNKIAEDFIYAADNLPVTQSQVGRATKFAAKAYLAKTRLSQAYEQDDQNQLSNINSSRLEEVVSLTNEVINSGQYGLYDDIRKNFLWDFDNGIESIFAVQYSIDDGTPMGNVNMEEALNYNTDARYGCCSFHQPSQNMVNAFKTDPETGLPMFDTFNDVPMIDPEDFWTNTVDPRLDHTVGIPTHPFKYDPNFIYSADPLPVRDPDTYGPFSPMRSVQHPDCPCKTVAKGYAYDTDSKNKDIIRYDEVLLWKAEALIQLGRQDEALPIINDIRGRAQNSTGYLKMADGSPISNYKIELYIPGENCEWTQDFAFKALRWERRLELAMEGERLSDLVRWGIADEVMNKYFDKEREYRIHLKEAKFTKGRDEYMPISQTQIDLSKGLYIQNAGYE
jgi:starch-binding outer membrane protein, SusD/RagB family